MQGVRAHAPAHVCVCVCARARARKRICRWCLCARARSYKTVWIQIIFCSSLHVYSQWFMLTSPSWVFRGEFLWAIFWSFFLSLCEHLCATGRVNIHYHSLYVDFFLIFFNAPWVNFLSFLYWISHGVISWTEKQNSSIYIAWKSYSVIAHDTHHFTAKEDQLEMKLNLRARAEFPGSSRLWTTHRHNFRPPSLKDWVISRADLSFLRLRYTVGLHVRSQVSGLRQVTTTKIMGTASLRSVGFQSGAASFLHRPMWICCKVQGSRACLFPCVSEIAAQRL